ncbi:hypothetical protein FE257_008294 [Aspergillus nanangensis]|uniref:BZIP domain-containing protein n=1 Tax=Aspergillus nanangensis TaxID=2582783 RepID=A0AAD4GSP9_ASPNN|nr:hypothetical protein FE257_008294 [Aspergillus nanangensis]
MANLLVPPPSTDQDIFACTDPQQTLLLNPMEMTNALCDDLLSESQSAGDPNLAFLQPNEPPNPLHGAKNNPTPNNDRQSMLFSYDGLPAPIPFNMISPFATENSFHQQQQLLNNSNTVIKSEDQPEDKSPGLSSSSSSPPSSCSPPHSRRPSRRGSKLHDDQRERFLEKNRIAANKHRKRKKQYIQGLESRYGEQLSRKDHLKAEVSSLRAEALDLQESLFTHARCEDEPIQSYISNKIGCLYANPPIPGSNGLVGTYIF